MAKSIMIQGTMSNVGKSLLVTGLCRIFKQDGYRVAPFKSQNMALNSYITQDNLEMGRAQAVQAEACGIEPQVCMNPILLKPTGDMGSQVIVNGEVIGNMCAMDYYKQKRSYLPVIQAAYHQLEEAYDIIVIEGAGSPAELNLKQEDIVNMGMAELVDAPVLLVGDIDRGGVFAQLIGTVLLLEPTEQARIKGLIVNKFRGDKQILAPGLSILTHRCGKEVLGVVPYMDVEIEEEDSLAEELKQTTSDSRLQTKIDIAVIRLPHISNFTDFQAFVMEPTVSLRYVERVSQLKEPDVIILPGTKNTMQDMHWLRTSGLETQILRLVERGTLVIGICGGYQMLGEQIKDPYEVEDGRSIRGMGLLPMITQFEAQKTRTRVKGHIADLPGVWHALSTTQISGYEIHMGHSIGSDKTAQPLILLPGKTDGCCQNGVLGTYLHGMFEEEAFRIAFVQLLCARKGIPYGIQTTIPFYEYKEQQYDKIAAVLRDSLDMEAIYRILNR
ncbi:MAG: cobyric acid synthase [Lachnospiraceae bacterium]